MANFKFNLKPAPHGFSLSRPIVLGYSAVSVLVLAAAYLLGGKNSAVIAFCGMMCGMMLLDILVEMYNGREKRRDRRTVIHRTLTAALAASGVIACGIAIFFVH